MKKKLLTVLLAVVMVFGVFGLTACGGGTNPDEEYNYYGTKYELDGDVKIEAATFQGVYKMFTTAGNFLLYIDSEANAASRFQAVNKLAQDWDVTIYHFNPDLSGGYANKSGDVVPNILKDVSASDQMVAIQDLLVEIAGVDSISDITDNTLYAIKGAESTTSDGKTVTYKGSIASSNTPANGASVIASIAQRKPSYAQYAENGNTAVPAAYNTANINTMNLFGDSRLHMYEEGVNAYTEEKTDVYVTVANYGQFAHLMDNNEGYFAVFFGGTWCPNTQAIAMLTNDLAKDYGISKIYMFDPRLDNGVRLDVASASEDENGDPVYSITENSGNITGNLNTRNNDVTAQWTSLGANGQLAKYIAQAEAVLGQVTTVTDGGDYADTVATKYDSEAIDGIINAGISAAVQAGLSTGYAAAETAAKAEYTEADWNKLDALAKATAIVNAYNATADNDVDINTYIYEVLVDAIEAEADTLPEGYADLSGEELTAKIESDAEAAYKSSVENYAYLYARFLDQYLSDYASEWNYNVKLTIGGKAYTRMCVPNMMMFNGEGEGHGKLVGLAEAEYTYANTSVEGNYQREEWTNAIMAIFDENPYAYYAPLPDEVEATEEEAAGGESAAAPSAPAADAGGC